MLAGDDQEHSGPPVLRLIGWLGRHARLVQAAEWALAAGCLGWGLWRGDLLWIACGTVAVLLNLFMPFSRASGLLPRVVKRPRRRRREED